MGLSLNPADIWKMFADGKRKDKEQIADWLDGVAAEARAIADVWATTYQRLATNKLSRDDEEAVMFRLGFYQNRAPNQRLMRFYETASTVFGGRTDQKLMDKVVNTIGSVVANRAAAVKIHRDIMRHFDGLRFVVDDTNSPDQMSDFRKSVDVINREAAALEVLARNFRASK
jgi:hypothetical protein